MPRIFIPLYPGFLVPQIFLPSYPNILISYLVPRILIPLVPLYPSYHNTYPRTLIPQYIPSYPRTPDIHTLVPSYPHTPIHTLIPQYIPSYPSYPRTPRTLVPRIFIPSYPRTPDIHTLVPSYPLTSDIHTLVPRQVLRWTWAAVMRMQRICLIFSKTPLFLLCLISEIILYCSDRFFTCTNA